jgi:pyruvate kinase
VAVIADLQGPKLRIGELSAPVELVRGEHVTIAGEDGAQSGDLPVAPDVLGSVLRAGNDILIDDGSVRLRVEKVERARAHCEVLVGGTVSSHKGVNLPGVPLPIPSLTRKDIDDLQFALELGVDYVALSFVRTASDVQALKTLIEASGSTAHVIAKIEKAEAVAVLDDILREADAVMVARGDLGVELPPQDVPPMQKRIVECARRMGRPVVVATQMLESMIKSPTPTRAEVSDVATAIYDGADAVMLSAESAAGDWPEESVAMMNSIATAVERDPGYAARVHFTETRPDPTTADALAEAAGAIAKTVSAAAIICFTASGSTARRVARERPSVPLLVLTPKLETARRLGILWGAHAVRTKDVVSFEDMIAKSKRMALRHNMAKAGDRVIVMAGVPFGTPGSTNVLHVARIVGDELKRHNQG